MTHAPSSMTHSCSTYLNVKLAEFAAHRMLPALILWHVSWAASAPSKLSKQEKLRIQFYS